MPAISKIRFTNVLYENGDKRYNDDIFEFDGQNGAVLLENGGGKTVFIQTALQAVVPNVEVADRKMKNTLLLENSPAHIAIEWIINERPRRYAITAVTLFINNNSLDSYKYVYEYDEGDDESIENIPFVIEDINKTKRPSSKDEINDYYTKMSQNRMNAHTFSTKKAYCDYIEDNFKIIPSEWSKIAEINGAEGGVEEFFNSCKTTGQLVDNLLIPTVEASVAGEGTKAFADIFEKQREHLKKLKQLKVQIKESRTVCDRINGYVDIYKNYYDTECSVQEKKSYLKAVYDFESYEKEENDRKNQLNIRESEENFHKEEQYKKKKASYELKLLKDEMNEKEKQHKKWSDEYEKFSNERYEILERYSNLKNAAFKQEIKSENDLAEVYKKEINELESDKEVKDIQKELEQNSGNLNAYFNNEENKLNTGLNEISQQISHENEKLEQVQKSLKEVKNRNAQLIKEKDENAGKVKILESDMEKIENAVLNNKNKENIKDCMNIWKVSLENIEKRLYDYINTRSVLKNKKEETQNEQNLLRQQLKEEGSYNASLNSEITSAAEKIDKVLMAVKEFKTGWFNYDRECIYTKQETILSQIGTSLEILRDEKEKSIITERIANRYSDDYKESEYFTADFVLEKLIKKWRSDISYIESGSEYIKKYAETFNISIKSLMDIFPYWPVCVVTSEDDVFKVKSRAEKCSDNISYPIMILSEKEAKLKLNNSTIENFHNIIIPHLWKNSCDKDYFNKWKSEILKEALDATEKRKIKEKEFNNVNELFNKVQAIYEECPYEHYREINKSYKESEQRLQTINESIRLKEKEILEIDEKIENLNRNENNDNSAKYEIESKIKSGREYILKCNERDNLKILIKRYENEISDFSLEIEKFEKDTEFIKNEINNKNNAKNKIKDNITKLQNDELYMAVKESDIIFCELSFEALKKIREQLNDRLNNKINDRNALHEKIKSCQEKKNLIERQFEEFKAGLEDGINIDEELQVKEGDRDEIKSLLDKRKEIEKSLKKIKKQYDDSKSSYNISSGAYKTVKENYFKDYDNVIEFNIPNEEIIKMLETEKAEIDKKKNELLSQQKKINNERKDIEDALYKLQLANEKENFILNNNKNYELSEEEKSQIPYKRNSIIKGHINEYKSILESMNKEKEHVSKEKDEFIKFCENNINDIKLKDMAVSGVRMKNTLSEIEKWQNMMNERISRAIDMAESDMREHDKEIQQFINHIHSYLVTVCDELRSIPKKTRIKIDDAWKDVFVFDVPSWDEKEGRQNISEYIDFIIEKLEDEKFKDESGLENSEKIRTEIEKSLVTKQLLKVVMGDKVIKVKCRKVTNDGKMRSAPFSWEISNNWSGGEKWSKNMSLFLGILNYTAEKRKQIKPLMNKKHYRSVIVDNPFGKASSEHVLNPVFFIAEQLGFQIIALTAHAEGKFIRAYFPIIYSLKLRNSKNNVTQIITKEKEIRYAYFKDSDDETLIRMGAAQQTSFL